MKNRQTKEVSTAFKWFYAGGSNMVIGAVFASYYSIFMTDTMKIPAAAASMIMFIATLWDAVNDPIMGVLADRTNTKWGRYRPYFIPAPILMTLFSTLLWINPNISVTGKIIWVAVFYIANGMTNTMVSMPYSAILPACVRDNQTRNSIVSMAAGITALSFTIGSTFTPQITTFFENIFHISNGYIPYMLVCGALSCVALWGIFITSKERYLVDNTNVKATESLKTVLRHKELIPYIIVWIMASLGYGLMFSASVYYVMYYLERPDLISVYMGVMSVGALVSMIVLMPIVLKIFKSGHRALLFSAAGSITCYLILFFVGKHSFIILCVLTFIATCIASMQNSLVNVLVNDAIDYIQYKDGISANGVIASIKGFAQKCGNTVVSSGILAILAAFGYIPNAIGQQPDSAMFAINFVRFGAPALTALIIIICLQFNPVEKCSEQIEEMKRRMAEEK